MNEGTCEYCQCTDERACTEGCSWANDERTLCSSCAFAEQVAFMFSSVLERVRGGHPPIARVPADMFVAWGQRPLPERQALVTAARVTLDTLRESSLESIGEEAAAGAVEIARLARFLLDKHPDACSDDKTAVDVALELLGERRIVLAT